MNKSIVKMGYICFGNSGKSMRFRLGPNIYNKMIQFSKKDCNRFDGKKVTLTIELIDEEFDEDEINVDTVPE